MKKLLITGLISASVLCFTPVLTGCDNKGSVETVDNSSPFSSYEDADVADYEGFKNYTREIKFKDVTVKDVDKAMKGGESFVLYCGFKDCPWCNRVISLVNDTAIEYGTDIAYIDTRKDPSWKSNLDMDDYDVFVKYFGDYLDTDSDGKKHLYVPHIFFIKDGVVVEEHPGTVAGHENSGDELTDEQKKELKKIYSDGFKKVLGM